MCVPAELYQFNYSYRPGLHSDTASFLRELKHPCNFSLTHYTHVIDMHTLKSTSATHTNTVVVVIPCWLADAPPPPLPPPAPVPVPRPQNYLKINYLNKPAVRSGCQPLTPEVNNLFEIHYCVERCDRALQDSAFLIPLSLSPSLSVSLSLHKLTTVLDGSFFFFSYASSSPPPVMQF